MPFDMHNDIISRGATIIAVVNTERAAQYLARQGYHASAAIAGGALLSSTETRALARDIGLLSIDTTAARAAGLVQ